MSSICIPIKKLFEKSESSFIDSLNQKLYGELPSMTIKKASNSLKSDISYFYATILMKTGKNYRKYFRVISQNPIFGLQIT